MGLGSLSSFVSICSNVQTRKRKDVVAGVQKAVQERYLVDPASSHMLVSKIKPCMSKYEQLYTVKLRMAH